MDDNQQLQAAPHSVEAEQSVLGAVLLDNQAWELVGDVLAAGDFFVLAHKMIWHALAELITTSKAADVVTVYAAMRLDGSADDFGGMGYLNDLMQSVPSWRTAASYAAIVLQRSARRKLMALGRSLADDAQRLGNTQADVNALIDRTAIDLIALQHGAANDEPRLIGDLLPPWLDALQDRADGKTDAIPMGLADIDRLLSGGMRRGEVIVIGARPSMGKSAFMLTVARNVSHTGPVLVCSMEDSDQMLVSRQVAAAGRVNLAHIRAPDKAPDSIWQSVEEGISAIRPLCLYLDDRPALTLHDVKRKALQVRRKHGDLLLVIVDYLQLMDGDGETRAYELAAVARGLKRLAKEMGCVVMLLSQLSREADKLDGPPRIDHLAESGGIEQAADIIGLLWREHRRKPRPDNKHAAQIEFAKHKNGATDTIKLFFDGATQRFENRDSGYEH